MTAEDVEALERARCAAMTGADVARLDQLLSKDLRWVHASGNVDTKEQMLEQFRDGSMRVFALDRTDPEVSVFGTAAVVTGVVQMDAMVRGVRREVNSRYMGLWTWHDGPARLAAWQSARIS